MNWILVIIGILISLFLLIHLVAYLHKCKPHCDGAFYGEHSSDGCGGRCECRDGGIEKENGVCCYPKCDGLFCGKNNCDSGECACDRIPNGKCSSGRCCYAQEQNNVYCGDDGCGGTRTCYPGSTCSPSGVCASSGTSGWTYTILKSEGTQRKNVSSVSECAGWLPENVKLDLLNFPCGSDKDCPIGDKCLADATGKKFCNRNNIYQYWIYDPTDPSGYNCTKLLAGSNVCGVPKAGATSFNVLDNHGPDKDSCGISCAINPICPPSGINSCCPKDWVNTDSYCVDNSGQKQCCLNNPEFHTYQECLNTGLKPCETLKDAWWRGNKAEISNGVCGVQGKGSVSVNPETLKNPAFSAPCANKSSSDSCVYDDGINSFSGFCKPCLDGTLKCLPERTCVANYSSANAGGTCSASNIC